MLHEKPNEFFHWKNKLDELDHLPGEPVHDKASSWKKLHDRIREKPHHNRMIWYWAAAACVILIGGIQWIMVNQKDDKLVNDTRKYESKQSSNKSVIVKEDPVVDPTNIIIENNQKAPVTVKNKTRHRNLTDTVLTDELVVTTLDTIKEQSPEIMVNTMKPADTISIVAGTSVKKKLRVVHINELGNPEKDEMRFAGNTPSPAFQTKFINQDGLSSFSLSRNSSDNLVKIKLSPSN